MTIDKPSPGNLLGKIDEIIDVVNEGNSFEATGVISYTSVDTAPGVVLAFDQPGTQVGTDHSLPEGQLLFNIDQRAVVSVDFKVSTSMDADGFFRVIVSSSGSLPDLSYIFWGNDQFDFPLVFPGEPSVFNVTLPETLYNTGNILNWSCQHSGAGTVSLTGGGCMLYVLRTA